MEIIIIKILSKNEEGKLRKKEFEIFPKAVLTKINFIFMILSEK